MSPLDFVLLALACWRLAHLLSHEEGPGHVFAWIRERLGARYNAGSDKWFGLTGVGEMVVCPLCLSVYFAVFLVALWALVPFAWWLILILAVSGASSLLSLHVSRN